MRPTVLIAETDLEFADILGRLLARQGYEVGIVADGLNCLNRLRASPCQLLLLDLDLPWGGGDGVLAVMRDDPGLARVPVVVTSAAHAEHILPPVVKALCRPFALSDLLAGIRAAMTQHRPTSTDDCMGPDAPAAGRKQGDADS